MQSLDNNNKDAVNNKQKPKSSGSDSDSDSSSSSDNSFSESDEAEELNRVQIKMPLELSLSDLANAILQQNQKYVAIFVRSIGNHRLIKNFINIFFFCCDLDLV